MKKFKKNWIKLVSFILVFLFTFILRAHNYEKAPGPLHLDEMLYAWSGLYLIETGIPVSWSSLDYPLRAQVFKGEVSYKGGTPKTSVTLYKPWLDEPPLFSLIVGFFAHIYHVDRTGYVPSSFIRIPTVLMASLTAIFIFLIARLVSGYWTGLLAMLIFGTVPIFVFASRTALPENLIALIYTIIAFLLLKFYQKPNTKYILFIPLLVGMAGLSKPTGFFLILITAFVVFKRLIKEEQLRRIVFKIGYLFLATAPFVLAFIFYGLHYDAQIFWRITSIQSFRPVGFQSLAWFFISPAYKTSILVDGWYIFCMLMSFYFLLVPKTILQKLIMIFFIFWVGVVMVTGGEGDLLPWYRYPSFPFLAIIGSWGIQLLFKKTNFFTTFIAVGMFLSSRSLIVNAFRSNITPLTYRVSLMLTLLPSTIQAFLSNEMIAKLSKLVIVVILVAGIYFNVVYIYNEYEIVCENLTCPIVPTTQLSTLHFPLLWRLFVLHKNNYE